VAKTTWIVVWNYLTNNDFPWPARLLLEMFPSSASPTRRLKAATRTRRPCSAIWPPRPATSWFPKFTIRASRAVVIDVYDILQSKEDKATVPIYYEARLARIDLKPEEHLKIDPNFEKVRAALASKDAEDATKESPRRNWAR
jgi:hypothetical protein